MVLGGLIKGKQLQIDSKKLFCLLLLCRIHYLFIWIDNVDTSLFFSRVGSTIFMFVFFEKLGCISVATLECAPLYAFLCIFKKEGENWYIYDRLRETRNRL